MKRILITLIGLALLAAACAQPVPAQQTPTPAGTPTPAPAGTPTPAEAAALAHLVEALGLAPDQVAVVSSEAVDWPDSCLGISYPNARCAQAITPGFRVVLEANGMTYHVHTNADGSAAVVAAPNLTWHREGGIAGFCDDLFVTSAGVAQAGNCKTGETYPEGHLTDAEMMQLNDWGRQFGSVVIEQRNPDISDDMPIVFTMTGTGAAQPSEADQQAMLSWAQAVYDRLRP